MYYSCIYIIQINNPELAIIHSGVVSITALFLVVLTSRQAMLFHSGLRGGIGPLGCGEAWALGTSKSSILAWDVP